jgi:hypothetical protein
MSKADGMMTRAERRRRTALKFIGRVRLLEQSCRDVQWFDPTGHLRRAQKHDSSKFHASRQLIGPCRSTHPFDCGRPRCGVCSFYRYVRPPTRQEQLAALREKEQVREVLTDE